MDARGILNYRCKYVISTVTLLVTSQVRVVTVPIILCQSLLQPAMYCPCYFAFVIQIGMMMADAGKREQELLFRAGAKSVASGSSSAKLLAGVEETESETT